MRKRRTRVSPSGRSRGRSRAGCTKAWWAFLGVLLLFTSCDLDWKEQARRAVATARESKQRGRFRVAKKAYEKALELNPYHVQANYELGELYETRLFSEPHGEQRAIYYYSRYLDLKPPKRDRRAFVKGQCALLQKLIDGTIEDPVDAVRDFTQAASAESLQVFSGRLHATFIAALMRSYGSTKAVHKFLTRWHRQVQSEWKPIFRDIRKKGPRHYATVIVELGSGERRKLRFLLSDTSLWELAADESTKKR